MKSRAQSISLATLLALLAVLAALCLAGGPVQAAPEAYVVGLPAPAPVEGEESGPALSRLPLSFIANAGQEDPAVRFTVKGAGHTIFFSAQEIVFSAAAAETAVVRLNFPGANPHPVVEGLSRLAGTANFYRGSDPAAWRTHVPTYEAVAYRELYPGVDLVYSGTDGRLKSEFRLAAGVDPTAIQMAYRGLTGISLLANGALALETPLGTLLDEAPLVYQERDDGRQLIPGRYLFLPAAAGEHRVGFRLGAYDRARPLVIDPELTYSSFLGGSGDERALAVAAYEPNFYVTGQTSSTNFPVLDPLDDTLGGQSDAFVTKFYTASGTLALSYSTYLGGSLHDDARGIALLSVDNAQEAVYLTGRTDSDDFPTQGAIDATYNGGPGDAFVVKLNPDGTLAYATYLGGGAIDEGNAIVFGESSEFWYGPAVYVTGRTDSTNFPANALDTTANGGSDAFVTQVLDSGEDACVLGYSTYLGGSGNDVGYGIGEEWRASVQVTGRTESGNFPVQDALDATYGGSGDAFLAQIISGTASVQLSFSTYLGGAGSDTGYAVYVWFDTAHLAGRTESADFPTENAFQSNLAGGSDAFVAQVYSGSDEVVLEFSSYLGGRGNDEGRAIARGWGNTGDDPFYVAGRTGSNDWPTVNAVQPRHGGGTDDAFVTQVITRSGHMLMGYSTTLGGRGNEGADGVSHTEHGVWPDFSYDAVLAGWTDSVQWPATANALDKTLDGQSDAFMAQVSQLGPAQLESTVVGPEEGGEVGLGGGDGAYTGGFQYWGFDIPPGAVSRPATPVIVVPRYVGPEIRYNPNYPPQLRCWSSLPPAGGLTVQALPAEWLRPVTVTIEYDPAYFAGVDENDLRLYGQDAAGVWYDAACTTTQHPDCAGYIRDTVSDTITVTTLFAGNLGLGVEKPEKAVLGRVTTPGDRGKGTTALANVQILPDLGAAYAVTTDADGYYILSRLISGTYVITPMLEGYTFDPPQYTVTITSTDVTGYDFTATTGGLKYHIYLPLVTRHQ